MKNLALTILANFILTGFIFCQNVGIGTLDPDYTLEVNGTVGFNDYIYHNDDSNTWMGFPDNDKWELVTEGKTVISADGVNKTVKVNSDQDGYGFQIVGDAVDHLFNVDSQTDRIGIGTASPTYLFDISGDFRVVGDAVDHLFFIDASEGKVGIGTGTPASQLDVNGDLRVSGLIGESAFIVNQATKRVGLGTDNPACALDVVGEIAGDQLKLGNNSLPFLETVQTGFVDTEYIYGGNNAFQIAVTFPTPFNNQPYIIGTITNKSTITENIFTCSLRSVSNTQAIFNVGLMGMGNPMDTLRLTWMAWE